MGFMWLVVRGFIRTGRRARQQCRVGGRDALARIIRIGAAGDRRDVLEGQAVTGGLPPGGSGHGGRPCSCRAPLSAGSTWAVARRAGPRRLATHASPDTRGHTATSPAPCRQSPPAWLWFRSPSLSPGGPGHWREFSRLPLNLSSTTYSQELRPG